MTSFDVNLPTLDRMRALGAETVTGVAALASPCDTIILSLPKAAVVCSVMTEMLPALQSGMVVPDTSTSEPATSKALTVLGEARGFAFVDGPVSGGPAAAKAGTMTMLLGNSAEAIARMRPMLDIPKAKIVVIGGSGAGHATKIACNMLCAANLVLVGEAVRLAEAAGVRPQDLLEGINAGSGRSEVD